MLPEFPFTLAYLRQDTSYPACLPSPLFEKKKNPSIARNRLCFHCDSPSLAQSLMYSRGVAVLTGS